MRRLTISFIIFCTFVGTFFTSYIAEAAGPFTQGSGYEKGAYDVNAIQPTSENWSRHSRFDGPVKPVVKELLKASNWIDSGIVIGRNGTLYTGDVNGNVYAVSPLGQVKWKVAIGEGVEVRSAPVIGKDGTIYIGANTVFAEKDNIICKKGECLSGLLALNPDGTLKWKVAFPKVQLGNTIMLDQDGNIYFGTGYDSTGVLYVVRPDGKIIWQYENDRSGFITTPLITASGYLFAHNTYFKDRNFIKSVWSDFDTTFASPTVGPDETIYFGTYDGTLGAMGPDGTSKWELRLAHTINQIDGNTTMSYGSRISVTAALVNDDILYTGDEKGQFYSIRLSDVAKQPQYEALKQVWTDDGLDWVKDYAYYEMDDLNNLNEFNWIRQTDSWVSSIIVGQNGTIYVGTEEGYVYSYSPDGKLNWSVSLQNEQDISSMIYDLAIGKNQTLYALSGRRIYAIKDLNNEKEIVLHVDSKQASINGQSKTLLAAPFIKDGSTLVPLRFVSEELGAKVEWDAATQYVIILLEDKRVVLQANSHFVYVNGETSSLQVAPVNINGTTFVPLRFVSEELGKTVKWNAQNRSITIK